MKVSELLEKRREHWLELERLCDALSSRSRRTPPPATISRFATLYRAACADLALADSYQLPPNTVQYLHRLVGRAHNQLYRTRRFNCSTWVRVLLQEVPQRVFNDRCIQFVFCLFWAVFMLSAYLAYSKDSWPDYADTVLSPEQIEQLETSFRQEIGGRNGSAESYLMAGFYIKHNTGIGLQCFVYGLLVVPSLYVSMSNAAILGASFGYMARPDVAEGQNFFHFVTAHGPFELTAIALSAGAGLRLGLSWICTKGLSRSASLQLAGQETMPIMGSAMVLFFLAALIEGFLSPSSAPYVVKAIVAIVSSGLLTYYFVVLGMPRGEVNAT